jgi:hypothetical protein
MTIPPDRRISLTFSVDSDDTWVCIYVCFCLTRSMSHLYHSVHVENVNQTSVAIQSNLRKRENSIAHAIYADAAPRAVSTQMSDAPAAPAVAVAAADAAACARRFMYNE